MGKRGPTKKPTNLKILQGNPGKRPLNNNEPKFEEDMEPPKPPAHLNTYGKKEWKRIVPVLMKVRLITKADYAALAAYCQSYGRWVVAEKIIKGEGLTFVSDKGNVIQRPEVGIANTAMKNIVSFAREFGMTPSSRSNIKVDDTVKSENPFIKFVGNNSG